MGYYTKYTLKSEPNILNTQEFKQKFNEITGYNEYVFCEECEWYKHDEDMLKVSKEFDETLFMLDGEGEESGDIWRTYYFNGKMQECKAFIMYEEFDTLKLK